MWMLVTAVLVLLGVAGAISIPLLMHPMESYAAEDSLSETFTESDALLDALSDLEDAHRSGKLSDDDYGLQRERLERQYIAAVEGRAEES